MSIELPLARPATHLPFPDIDSTRPKYLNGLECGNLGGGSDEPCVEHPAIFQLLPSYLATISQLFPSYFPAISQLFLCDDSLSN
jgi:hypothetical protein